MTLPSSPQSREMIALIERLAPNEGYSLSALDGVRFMRSACCWRWARTSGVTSCRFMVCQGIFHLSLSVVA